MTQQRLFMTQQRLFTSLHMCWHVTARPATISVDGMWPACIPARASASPGGSAFSKASSAAGSSVPTAPAAGSAATAASSCRTATATGCLLAGYYASNLPCHHRQALARALDAELRLQCNWCATSTHVGPQGTIRSTSQACRGGGGAHTSQCPRRQPSSRCRSGRRPAQQSAKDQSSTRAPDRAGNTPACRHVLFRGDGGVAHLHLELAHCIADCLVRLAWQRLASPGIFAAGEALRSCTGAR